MGITAKFTKESISNDMRILRRKVQNDLLQILNKAGLDFVKDARNMTKAQGGFENRTGNLRSSIGYFILHDGVVVIENLEGYTLGRSAAMAVMNEIKKSSGFQLIGVAGMQYASWVESKGFNVITKQADHALVDLDKFLKKYTDRMSSKGIDVEFQTDKDSVTSIFI